jgi:hypothetical protein
MQRSLWFRRAGPGIAAIGALALVAWAALDVPPADARPAACPGAPTVRESERGAWYRLDPVLEDGRRVGTRLTAGGGGGRRPIVLTLAPEAFASGPRGGTVLLGSDDGRATRISLLDVARGCAWELGTGTRSVVRRAVLRPDRDAMVTFRVDRRTRADRGVWSQSLDGGPARRILGPLPVDARFGRTWATELAWSDDGSLVVASCGEVACRFRILLAAGGRPVTVADPLLGDLVGLAEGRLIARGACRGTPCPVFAVDPATGRRRTLDGAAGPAALARDAQGRSVVVVEHGREGLHAFGLDGDTRGSIGGPLGDARIVPPPWRTDGAVELAPGSLALSGDGRVPVGGFAAGLRRLDPHDLPLAGETDR